VIEVRSAEALKMTVRASLMRNVVHRKHASIVVAALFIAVALPVTVLFSREDLARRAVHENAMRAEIAADIAVPTTEIAASIAVPTATIGVTPTAEWTGDATQSASMVIVGTLLIGLGSIVRRAI
jgi:hypothetical protein